LLTAQVSCVPKSAPKANLYIVDKDQNGDPKKDKKGNIIKIHVVDFGKVDATSDKDTDKLCKKGIPSTKTFNLNSNTNGKNEKGKFIIINTQFEITQLLKTYNTTNYDIPMKFEPTMIGPIFGEVSMDWDSEGGTSNNIKLIGRGICNAIDKDGDGITDKDELGGNIQTNPKNIDSDNDGIEDGIEDLNRDGNWDKDKELNPKDADTDGDGLPDGEEDKNKNGKHDEGELNPFDFDTDKDGVADGKDEFPFDKNKE
jgi:hypothetical protein